MIDDVTLNKAAIIRRCLARIAEDFQGDPSRLDNLTLQDAITLNLLRACEASIDLAMHRVARARIGVPQTSRDAFDLLAGAGLLSEDSAKAMKNMVGFRNIAVHSYHELKRPILEAILLHHLGDFLAFSDQNSQPPQPDSA